MSEGTLNSSWKCWDHIWGHREIISEPHWPRAVSSCASEVCVLSTGVCFELQVQMLPNTAVCVVRSVYTDLKNQARLKNKSINATYSSSEIKAALKTVDSENFFLTHEIFAQILGSWCAKNGSLLPGSSIHPISSTYHCHILGDLINLARFLEWELFYTKSRDDFAPNKTNFAPESFPLFIKPKPFLDTIQTNSILKRICS